MPHVHAYALLFTSIAMLVVTPLFVCDSDPESMKAQLLM